MSFVLSLIYLVFNDKSLTFSVKILTGIDLFTNENPYICNGFSLLI